MTKNWDNKNGEKGISKKIVIKSIDKKICNHKSVRKKKKKKMKINGKKLRKKTHCNNTEKVR